MNSKGETRTATTSSRRTARGLIRHATSWAAEIAWCLGAVLLFLGLVVLLKRHDDKPLPQWPAGFTLNTAVALFATTLHAAVVLIISEAISQVKWNRFANQLHQLNDLYTFDRASRGPWGSLTMIARRRGGILGTVAAFLFVSGLATSTVTQSAIAYSTRMVHRPELRASLLVRADYGSDTAATNEDGARIGGRHPDPIENVVFQAVYHPSNQSWPVMVPSCPSGDCRWDTFESLAFCYDLRDVTENLTNRFGVRPSGLKQYRAEISLPVQGVISLDNDWSETGPFSSPSQDYSLMNWTSPWPNLSLNSQFQEAQYASFPPLRESVAHDNTSDILRSAVSQWLIIYRGNDGERIDEGARYRAAELIWHFCVKTYNVSVEQGRPKVRVLSTSTKVIDGQGYGWKATLAKTGTFRRNFSMVSEDQKNRFVVFDGLDYDRIDLYMRNGLHGAYSPKWSEGVSPYNEFSRGIAMKMFADVEEYGAPTDDEQVWQNLRGFAQTVADSMTDFITRKGAAKLGDALVSETFVRVRWQWLALIAIQTGLSVLFLGTVALYTARLGVDVVKSSNMAELFAGRCAEGASQASGEDAGLRRFGPADLVARLDREEDGRWILGVVRPPAAPQRNLLEPLRRRLSRR